MTIKDLLSDAREALSRKGTASLDAEVLLAFALGEEREYLVAHSEEEVDDGNAEVYRKYVEKAASGVPIAYLTHSKEFYGMDFYVDDRVLIPRPETEMVVEEVLEYFRGSDFACELSKRAGIVDDSISVGKLKLGCGTLLDVGCGSLCITAAVCHGFDEVYAHALDISEDALDVARINSEYHDLEGRVEIYQSDLLSSVDETEFDVIVANLPYIGEAEFDTAVDEVRDNEPGSALYGEEGSAGGDGLALYKKMIQEIKHGNIEFNLLVCEFGAKQEKGVKAMLSNFFDQDLDEDGGRKYNWEIKSDLADIPRIFVVSKR